MNALDIYKGMVFVIYTITMWRNKFQKKILGLTLYYGRILPALHVVIVVMVYNLSLVKFKSLADRPSRQANQTTKLYFCPKSKTQT